MLRRFNQDTCLGKMLVHCAPGMKEMITRTGARMVLDCDAGHTDISYRLVTSTNIGSRKKYSFAKNDRKEYRTVECMA